ncbi:hypothetical protein POTOM_009627 [Populus tomentosa]|uniref:Uncharacterized protein n=1 Tax=Populus tomentosa TaxID=118781 RepID=A0A8X8ABD5_POPTO|nr:hypothetical protein POTOM_009627 [Populus tomentosa]
MHAVLVAGLYPMAAGSWFLPPKIGKRVVETASGAQSLDYKLSFWKSNDYPLVIYDEITRGDGLRGISLPAESVESLTSMVRATETASLLQEGEAGMNQNPNSFLSSLMNNDTRQQTIPSHTLQGPASAGNGSGKHGRLGLREASSRRRRGNAAKEHVYYL